MNRLRFEIEFNPTISFHIESHLVLLSHVNKYETLFQNWFLQRNLETLRSRLEIAFRDYCWLNNDNFSCLTASLLFMCLYFL